MIKATGDNVILKVLPLPEKSSSGIFLPNIEARDAILHQHKALKCEVVAVGPGKRIQKTGKLIPTTLKPGDIVLRDGYAGDKIQIGGQEYIHTTEAEIIAKLN